MTTKLEFMRFSICRCSIHDLQPGIPEHFLYNEAKFKKKEITNVYFIHSAESCIEHRYFKFIF